jgi:hypothetical protein
MNEIKINIVVRAPHGTWDVEISPDDLWRYGIIGDRESSQLAKLLNDKAALAKFDWEQLQRFELEEMRKLNERNREEDSRAAS